MNARERWKWGWLDTDMLVDRVERLQLDQVGGYVPAESEDAAEVPDGATDLSDFLEGFGDSCRFNDEFKEFHSALMASGRPVLSPPSSLRSAFGLVKDEQRGKRRRVSVKHGSFHGLPLKAIAGISDSDGAKRVELSFARPLKEVEKRLVSRITLGKIRADTLGSGDPRDVYTFKKNKKEGAVVCAWK